MNKKHGSLPPCVSPSLLIHLPGSAVLAASPCGSSGVSPARGSEPLLALRTVRGDDLPLRFPGACPLPQLCALVRTEGAEAAAPESKFSSRSVSEQSVLGAGGSEGPGDTAAAPYRSRLQRGHGPAPARLSALPLAPSPCLGRSLWLQQHPLHAPPRPVPGTLVLTSMVHDLNAQWPSVPGSPPSSVASSTVTASHPHGLCATHQPPWRALRPHHPHSAPGR